MHTSEFQAVVLAAGSGSRFPELTAHRSKCLLPIGNKPMVWFPLRMLANMGFQEVIVIVSDQASKSEVAAIPKRFGGLEDIRLDVVALHSSSTNINAPMGFLGTADALKQISNQLTAPRIIVVSSDLVTNVQMHNLTDLHRVHEAAVTMLLSRSHSDSKKIAVPGPKSKQKRERDVVGIDKASGRVCLFSSEADLDDAVTIHRAIIKTHPRISLFNNLLDGHLYVFERWVIDYLSQDENVSSIKGELLPYLVKKQFAKPKSGPKSREGLNEGGTEDEIAHNSDIFAFATKSDDDLSKLACQKSCWNDHSGDLKDCYHDQPIRCYAHVMEGGICTRVNTLASYIEINQQIARLLPVIAPGEEKTMIQCNKPEKGDIGSDCFVGEKSTLADGTLIRSSTIGSGSRIQDNVRLTNCILMDNVEVGQGCVVSGSIICDGAILPAKCVIKDCIIGKGFEMVEGAKHANELLMDAHSRMMEI